MRPLIAIVLTACTVELEVPEGSRIACDGQPCPEGLSCYERLQLCVESVEALPSLAVAFTLPRDGDLDVGLSSSMVVVFNMAVVEPSPGDLTLEPVAGGAPIALSITTTSAGNTWVVEPQTPLEPLTDYVLTVAAGIEPSRQIIARPSVEPWAAQFTSAQASDVEPPPVVEDFVVARASAASGTRRLGWALPAGSDAVGVLLLRGAQLVDAAPEAGRPYFIGETLGNAEVIYAGNDTELVDPVATLGDVYYALVAFDAALNYSPVARTAGGASLTITWCPDHTGSFSIASSAGALVQLQVATSADAALGSGTFVPLAPLAAGTSVAIAEDSVFVPGTTLHLRAVARYEHSAYIGPSQSWMPSQQSLAINAPTFGDLGTFNVPFTRYAWPAFEVQVDTDPAEDVESYGGTGTTTTTHLVATFSERGYFRVRARPVVASCNAAPFQTSTQFRIGGGDLYVLAGATGTGLSPTDPAPTVAAVLAGATSGSVIHVAGGDYVDQSITLRRGVRYEGGWDATFTTRDPAAHVSHFSQSSSGATVVNGTVAPYPDVYTLLDGFTLSATSGNLIQTAGSPTLSNNILSGPAFGLWYGIEIAGYYAPSDSRPTIRDNLVTAPIPLMLDKGEALVEDNELHGGTDQYYGSLACWGGDHVVRRNLITQRSTSGVENGTVRINPRCHLVLDSNIIEGPLYDGLWDGYAIGVTSGSAEITNNLIHGGNAANSVGILIEVDDGTWTEARQPSVLIAHNTLHAGIGDGSPARLFGPRSGIVMRGANYTWNAVNYVWDVRVVNNLLIGEGTWRAFQDSTTAASFAVLQNNVVVDGGSTAVFFRELSGADLGVVDGEADVCAESHLAGGNVLLTGTTLDSVFLDPDGADADLATLGDNDWRLEADAPAAIRDGGLTLASGLNCGGASCGGAGGHTLACGVVAADHLAGARTDEYSAGAFEQP